MKINKTKLLFIATLFFLAIPLIMAGTASAAGILQFPWVQHDGASLNANGGYQIDDPGACISDAAKTNRNDCTTTTNSMAQGDCQTYVCMDGTSGTQAACNNAGYAWVQKGNWSASACYNRWSSKNFYTWTGTCSNPTYTNLTDCTFTGAADWQPTNVNYPNGHFSMGSDRQGCLHCHSDVYMYGRGSYGEHGPNKDKYLLTGHRNMLRKVTGSVNSNRLGASYYTSNNSTVANKDGGDLFAAAVASTYSTVLPTDYYIYGGWYRNVKQAQLMRYSKGGGVNVPGAPAPSRVTTSAYTCGNCHTTGWDVGQLTVAQGDAVTLEPTNGANFGGHTTYYTGVQCSECHKGQPVYRDYFAAGNVAHAAAAEYEEANELCYHCHEQTGPEPFQVLVSPSATNMTDFNNFTGHYRSNQFFNSPHARFEGTEGQVTDMTRYESHFSTAVDIYGCSLPAFTTITDCTTNSGTWDVVDTETHNSSCTKCHDVHISSVDPDVMDQTNTYSHIKPEATCGVSCHSTKLNNIKHPVGPGTPLDGDLTTDKGKMMACITCHMGPGTVHLFRINTDPNYSPFVSGQTLGATYQEEPGSTYPAVGMSLDLACGQCHGGSQGQAKPGIPVMDLQQLAAYAEGMHGASSSAPTAKTFLAGSGDVQISDYTVTFSDASTNSDHAPATDMKVTVNWGDGNVSTGVGGSVFSHTYTTAATFYILHTVSLNNQFDTETLKAVVPSAVLGGGTVGVQVDDYTPAGLADVSLYLKQNGITKKLGATDGTGAFTFMDVPSGTYDLIAYKYGVLLTNDCGGVVTVNGTTPNPTCTFTQTQTQFNLTVNAPEGHVVTVKQAGVTKGIQKVGVSGSVSFGRLAAGSYTVDGYAFQSTCTQAAVTLGPDATVSLTCP